MSINQLSQKDSTLHSIKINRHIIETACSIHDKAIIAYIDNNDEKYQLYIGDYYNYLESNNISYSDLISSIEILVDNGWTAPIELEDFISKLKDWSSND